MKKLDENLVDAAVELKEVVTVTKKMDGKTVVLITGAVLVGVGLTLVAQKFRNRKPATSNED